MSHKDLAGGVYGLKQFPVKFIELIFRSPIIQPEANQAEINWSQNLKSFILSQLLFENFSQMDVFSDDFSDSLDTIRS